MVDDFEKMAIDYAECYKDKTRIKFVEKYFSTFNASVGRMTPFMLFPRQKVFLKSIATYPASIAIKHRQCRHYNHNISMGCGSDCICFDGNARNCVVYW